MNKQNQQYTLQYETDPKQSDIYYLWQKISNIALYLFIFFIILRIFKIKGKELILLFPFIGIAFAAYITQGEERYLIPAIPFLILLWAKLYEREIMRLFNPRKFLG